MSSTPRVQEFQAATFGDLLAQARAIRLSWKNAKDDPEEVWYRGQRQRSFHLIPGLVRDRKLVELDLFESYRALASGFLEHKPDNDWQWLFLMQHYGLPTRLLDWSESLSVATYFALEGVIRDQKSSVAAVNMQAMEDAKKDPPTVWLLDAGSLTKQSFAINGDKWLATTSPHVRQWAPITAENPILGPKARLPVAIFPHRTTPRIAAQRGLFTIHGSDQRPIEEVMMSAPPGDRRIACITLTAVEQVWDDLRDSGVSKLQLFPEIAHLAEHVTDLFR